jgi:cytochrome oxidase Cu insertion factor (SCO1/SenC/PrrC family)
MKKSNKLWILMPILVATAAAGWFVWARPANTVRSNANESVVEKPPPLTEFELVKSDGSTLHSDQLQDQVWVASYFFTQCGANCRMLNMKLSELQREYGPRGVKFVSITCDPKNDSPEALAKYSKLFNANKDYWSFATGEMDYLRRLGVDFFDVSVTERGHHAQFTIMDRDSKCGGVFQAMVPEDVERARTLLDQLLGNHSDATSSGEHDG